MSSSKNKKSREIIERILYITIATASKDGKPWNSPVYSAFDKNYNFYWNSWTENQHSKNIAENPNVFLVIYNSIVPEGTGEGVYIKAKAYMVTDEKEIKLARELLVKRKNKPSGKLRDPREFMGKYPRRVYKALPEKVWINSEGDIHGEYIDTRVEVDLFGKL